MAQVSELKDLMKRMVRKETRVVWTADVRARRSTTDDDTWLIIGGPGPVSTDGALVSVSIPDEEDPAP